MDLSLATTSFTYDGLPHMDVGLSVTATDPNGVFSTVLVEGEDYEVVWPDDAVNVG